jgi:manganese/zinc/iron transport system ATP- binding protein
MPTKNAISVNHLTVLYGTDTALMDVSCTIPAGVLCVLVGPNGAGKSTLLKALLGLVRPLAGTVEMFGKPVDKASNLFAYVPQRSSVDWQFPIVVYDVVMMGRYAQIGFCKRPSLQDAAYVEQALAAVGMLAFKDRLISELSGGQQQRVVLARALAQRAPILLLDEPFTGVDATTESLCIQVLQQLRDQGGTIVLVHHDLAAVTTYADWAVLLQRTLIKAGPLSTVLTPLHVVQAYGRSVFGISDREQTW